MARQQAQREEELAQSQRQISALQVNLQVQMICDYYIILGIYKYFCLFQDEIEELERENRLHSQQVGNLYFNKLG